MAAGFAFFALDDRFALHERLRDRVLAPHGISLPLLDWIAPGDFIVLAYAVISLWFLPLIWRLIAANPRARWRLAVGIAIAGLAVVCDSIDLALLPVDLQRLEQTIEECLELIAQVLFFQAFLCAFLDDIDA